MQKIKREIQNELKRIEEYWDKKTLFVHRRALVIGFIIGIATGINMMMFARYIAIVVNK